MVKYRLPKFINIDTDDWDLVVDSVKAQVSSLIDDIDAKITGIIEDAAPGQVRTDDVIVDIADNYVDVRDMIFDRLGLDLDACYTRNDEINRKIREAYKKKVKAVRAAARENAVRSKRH